MDELLIVISIAAGGDSSARESGSPSRREAIGAVHRLISDLARLVGRRSRVIAAGDWSIFRGWSSHPTAIWNKCEALQFHAEFDRMRALSLRHFMREGRRGHRDAVVTFKPIGLSPAQAWGQLDFVFATENFADRMSVVALNDPSAWGDQATTVTSSSTLTEPRRLTVRRSTLESSSAAILIARISNALSDHGREMAAVERPHYGSNPANVGRAIIKDTMAGLCRSHRQAASDHRIASIVRVDRGY